MLFGVVIQWPPSMTTVVPVIKLAASDAIYSVKSATSLLDPARPIGITDATCLLIGPAVTNQI